jgi:hypothetical protein
MLDFGSSQAAGMTLRPRITADALRGSATSFWRLLIANIFDEAVQQHWQVRMGQSVSVFNLKQTWS